MSKREGRPVEQIRWLIGTAAREFGLDDKTITARIKSAGVLPGEDGMFSTLDVAKSIYGDLEGERTRKTREEADQIAMENATTRGELLDLEDFSKRIESKASKATQIVKDFGLPEDKEEQLLNALSELFAVK